MSELHTGNVVPEITREEHDGILNAKKTSMVSAATIYAVVNTSAAGQASVVLDTGTNWIGLVSIAGPVTQSGTWNVGTLTTVTNDVNIADGGNVISVDDAGATLSIDDGGGAITVDGTVAVSSIAAGDNNIGNVDIASAIPAGTNYIGLASVNVGGVVAVDATGQGDVPITLGGEEVVLGTGANAIGKLAANTGVDIGDVDVTSISAGTNYIGLASVNIGGSLPAGTNAIGKLAANSGVDIGDVDVTSITGVTMSNAAIQTTGDEAHDAPDAGNPVKIGGKAKNFDGTAPGSVVAEDDRTDFINDVYGRQFVETSHPNLWDVSADYAAAQTNTTVKAAPGAGLKLYITDVMISNGATAGNITLLDGSGGTVLLEIYPAINGGAVMNLRTPIALTANTLLAITSTTVTTHSVFVSGYIAP
jgi:hypothetical protein